MGVQKSKKRTRLVGGFDLARLSLHSSFPLGLPISDLHDSLGIAKSNGSRARHLYKHQKIFSVAEKKPKETIHLI